MQNSGRVKTQATVRIRMKLHQNDATDDLYISCSLTKLSLGYILLVQICPHVWDSFPSIVLSNIQIVTKLFTNKQAQHKLFKNKLNCDNHHTTNKISQDMHENSVKRRKTTFALLKYINFLICLKPFFIHWIRIKLPK